MPSDWPVLSLSRPLTTTLVLVPISVQRPPRTTASFIGIRSLETLNWCLRAQRRTAGTIRATTGVLFINPERTAGMVIVRSWASASDRGWPSPRSINTLSAPVRSTAAATTNKAATVSMPSLLMPARASAGVRMPAASKTTTAPIIAMSGARRPSNNASRVAATTPAVRIACQCSSQKARFMRNSSGGNGERTVEAATAPGRDSGLGRGAATNLSEL